MPKKTHAGKAGPATPVKAPAQADLDNAPGHCPECKCGDRDLKATRSLHKTALAIARTRAWESVLTANLRPILAAVVISIALVYGVPMPWDWALAGVLGGAVTYKP